MQLHDVCCDLHEYLHCFSLPRNICVYIADVENWSQNLVHALYVLQIFIEFRCYKKYFTHDVVTI